MWRSWKKRRTAPTALAKIAKDQPDLVLLDLQMPVMGGFEVIRSLKGGAHIPIIVIITAYDRFALQLSSRRH